MSTDVGGKPATIKADRNILQRLVTAYRSGRPVNLDNILKHELLPVPVALSSLNGTLNTGNKSILADILSCSISTPPQVTVTGSASLVIDGQALINAIGIPSGAKTFFEYSTVFLQYVLSIGSSFHRADIVFDRYFSNSIKSTTRKRRRQGHRPIRRIIEDGSVPLPNNWGNFLSLEENKENLQEFVSEQLIGRAPENKIIVTAEGFKNIQEVRSSNPSLDTSALEGYHEEPDTRVVLHCINNSADSVVVYARDTDILVLLLAHFEKMPCKNLWLKAGTYKKPKYFPTHQLHQDLPKSQIESILAFHAITGCDSVSFIAGHSKKSAWKVFGTHYELLCDLGKSNQIKSNQIKSSQVKSSQVKSSQVKSSQVKSSQVKSSQVKSSQVKSSQVKSSQVKSSQVKSNQIKSNQIKSNQIKSNQNQNQNQNQNHIFYLLDKIT